MTVQPAHDPKDLGDPAPDGHPAIAAARIPKKHPEPARRPRSEITRWIQAQPSGVCPHCKRGVAFRRQDRRTVFPELIPQRNASGPDFSGSGHAAPARQPERWQVDEYVLECQFCKKTCVFFAYWGPDVSAWSNEPTAEQLNKVKVMAVELVYPRQEPRQLHTSAPEKMRDLFLEGARCEAVGAMRAAAGMYRAAVEELCTDKQATGRGLIEKIDSLAAQGVPAEIVTDLHEARLLGNWSLHDGLAFSADEVADVALLIEEAVTVVYVQPEERAAMRAARKARRDRNRDAQKNSGAQKAHKEASK